MTAESPCSNEEGTDWVTSVGRMLAVAGGLLLLAVTMLLFAFCGLMVVGSVSFQNPEHHGSGLSLRSTEMAGAVFGGLVGAILHFSHLRR